MPTDCTRGAVRSHPGCPWPSTLLLGVLLLGAACSVADNLSYGEIVDELDGIVRIEGTGTERRVAYADRAPTSAWYMRWFLLVPIRPVLGFVFGATQDGPIENPAGHVRELIRELPDETGGDLLACANAATRLAWIAEVEGNGQSRIVAIDGLAGVVQQLHIDLFAGPLDRIGAPADTERLASAHANIETGRPEARGPTPWDDQRLEPYIAALATVAADPLEEWQQRLHLLETLIKLYRDERDPRVIPAAATALRTAIGHCVRGVLLRTIQGRDQLLVELRLCAMEQIRRLGGPRTVPLMLAVMAASPTQRARNESRYDPNYLVQLRLIHYCGQLQGELATTEVTLPGRKEWDSVAPVDFLANTVLTEQTYYSKLRTPALVALTWSLRRPRFDPDPGWVSVWRQQRQAGS
ncbi:MAG TPA: hypothetical protein VFD82_10045 [Planctomycetota bacterium]|nr:hypothetical protein [Planctomycetota bacterium]